MSEIVNQPETIVENPGDKEPTVQEKPKNWPSKKHKKPSGEKRDYNPPKTEIK